MGGYGVRRIFSACVRRLLLSLIPWGVVIPLQAEFFFELTALELYVCSMEELDFLEKEINSQNLSPLDCICMLCYFQLWYNVSFDMVHPMPPEIDICEAPCHSLLPTLEMFFCLLC
jgi:hypothetical protein